MVLPYCRCQPVATERLICRTLQFPCRARCYHRIVVKPQTIGRVLGVGLRVAGRVAGERLAAQANRAQTPSTQTNTQARPTQTRPTAAKAAGSMSRGIGGFLKPFGRVSGIVFLEVMGVFFLLFVLVFARGMWQAHTSYLSGPNHSKFIVSAGLALLFLYLSVTSFLRARKR